MDFTKLRVLKFGGSSLATPEQIKAVAAKITALYHQNIPLIVVTSAMGKTTDQLTDLAFQVSHEPNRRELDMLLTTGERISMALMSMALHDLKCPSISFTGSQAGILTDGAFSNAQIKEIKPFRVEEALREKKVVVLAGFQGVDPITKEITTLGRGGSDITAIAMAAHFQAERCEILKDVDGVFSADPKIVANAQLFRKMPIDVLYDFCFWGAKVLNYRAVDLARKNKVPLFVGRSDNFSLGTEVCVDDKIFETQSSTKPLNYGDLVGVNAHRSALEIALTCSDLSEALSSLHNLAMERGLPDPQVLMQEYSQGSALLILTADSASLKSWRETFRYSAKVRVLRDNISVVAASFAGKPVETKIVNASECDATIRGYF